MGLARDRCICDRCGAEEVNVPGFSHSGCTGRGRGYWMAYDPHDPLVVALLRKRKKGSDGEGTPGKDP